MQGNAFILMLIMEIHLNNKILRNNFSAKGLNQSSYADYLQGSR